MQQVAKYSNIKMRQWEYDTSILMLSNGSKYRPLIDWLAATMQAEAAKDSNIKIRQWIWEAQTAGL
jgi:hypothetical protein